eukprot:TRINITY_DN18229_c0_g1_i1.p1 TRINITY_DN18229_c0_g1~~TRINITY_DN18229_c0_g1_i1.p1  ORF type:complete len:277 (-),score=71.00 TRINITY_DN18229_c0_g1_i1:22-822(-)
MEGLHNNIPNRKSLSLVQCNTPTFSLAEHSLKAYPAHSLKCSSDFYWPLLWKPKSDGLSRLLKELSNDSVLQNKHVFHSHLLSQTNPSIVHPSQTFEVTTAIEKEWLVEEPQEVDSLTQNLPQKSQNLQNEKLKSTTLSSLTSSCSTLTTLSNSKKEKNSVASRNTAKRLEFISTVKKDLNEVMKKQKTTNNNETFLLRSSFREQLAKDMEVLRSNSNTIENRLNNTAKKTREIIETMTTSPQQNEGDFVTSEEEYFSCEDDETEE